MNPECIFILFGGLAALFLFLFTDVWDFDVDDDDDDDENSVLNRSGIVLSESPSSVPSPVPTLRPTLAPVFPTAAPVTPAPTITKSWERIAGPFTSDTVGTSLFGHSVAFVGNYLAIGQPEESASGGVTLYTRSTGNTWQSDSTFSTPNAIEFGYSVAGAVIDGNPHFVVGAVDTNDLVGSFGSAYVFERDLNSLSAVGTTLRPSLDPAQSANAKFGTAVAMATDVPRVAIGAPFSNDDDGTTVDNGRVYTFEYDGSTWQPMGGVDVAALVGSKSDKLFGASLDLSNNGDWLLVGLPGDRSGDGAIFLYEWIGTEWKSRLPLPGLSGSLEAMGTTVRVISQDGKSIAFGGPNFGDRQGSVQVYQESFPGFFIKLGNQNIIGEVGEKIGTTLCGAQNRIGFGTDLGSFRVYEYDNGWVEVATGPIDLGSKVVSMDMSDDAQTVVVGLENEQVLIYELQ
eukprot:CAMPEP_0198149038 /NCGR_PEP_ID=MMETSP1443-20131203/44714_1 /TAXON_ID=186043 /ORGANISM="Entomoneis sp., Strain CCMP2396" /LENGTH=456 /DNA_ID=CAMNT_0043813939 /DNA_START=57 /DNA_END=1427 /DNA_ORIENTATION=-